MARKAPPKSAKVAKRRPPAKRKRQSMRGVVREVRMGVLEDLLVQLMPWEDIVAILGEPPPRGFGLTEELLESWARVIRQRWRAEADATRAVLKAEHRARVGAVFRRAYQRDNTMADKVALDAEKVLAQIDGVLLPGQVVVNNNTLNIAALTPMQRQQEIDQLLEKRRAALAARGAKSLPSATIIEATAAERR
jgi:hypothetical protein